MNIDAARPSETLPIAVLLVLALVLGLAIAPDYGQNWDEPALRQYTAAAAQSYSSVFRGLEPPSYNANLGQYGPAFFILAASFASLLEFLVPSSPAPLGWHIASFLAFLAGVGCLYLLARRWMSAGAATGAALLLLAQPLLWGHAFMNAKDIPMMSLFIGAVYLGLRMSDSVRQAPWITPRVIPAGIALGLVSTLRVAGPLAGVIVLVHLFYVLRKRSWALAGSYVAIAALVGYLSWPWLWDSPVQRYLDSVAYMAAFPWNQPVLFAGQIYAGMDLPVSYFPTILAIQLTEPLLLLLAGALLLAGMDLRRGIISAPLLLLLSWFLLPAFVIVDRDSTLYDNARQTFFLLPPLFLMAGTAFDRLFGFAKSLPGRAVIVTLALLPGIVAGIRLHPYEYVYYNALVDGTTGAYGEFEMDYWGTSFKEAAQYLNGLQQTEVLAIGPDFLLGADLPKGSRASITPGDVPLAKYVVILLRGRWNAQTCSNAPVVHSVSRWGAAFTLVRQLPPGGCK